MNTDTRNRAAAVLGQMLGEGAGFREGQLEAIEALVDRRERVLVVQRTGWGKSFVYFIATRLLRDAGAGPTLLISPLLALMRNQIATAEAAGVRAHTINSSNREAHDAVEQELRDDAVDLLLISPERLNNPKFRSEVLASIAGRTGLLVIDEAHCISDWGHDFRPDYRRVVSMLSLLPAGVPVLATTATANDRVVDDVTSQLGIDLRIQRGSLDRESLSLHVLQGLRTQPQRYAWLSRNLADLEGTGIIYCLTIRDANRLAAWLEHKGFAVASYSGATDSEARLEIERRFMYNELKAIVATSALGMGYDKADVGFVIHFQMPGSTVAYYQQVGRAGRSLERAYGILMCGQEDRDIQDYFVQSAFPPEALARAVVNYLGEVGEPRSTSDLLARVNIRQTRLEALLKILEVEGAVERVGGKWQRTLRSWDYDAERVELVTRQRRTEQERMHDYATTPDCLMEYLRKELDDPQAVPCGRCMNDGAERLPLELDPAEIEEAAKFLRTEDVVIEPRLRWPYGLEEPRGNIPPERRNQPGRALSLYNDGGWGHTVAHAKHELGFYSDELVAAMPSLIKRWKPQPAPQWVTCVPSLEHPELVPEFARKVAHRLGLPFEAVIGKTRATQPQKEMENSAKQVRNIWEAFEISGPIRPEPVLLLDDTVDSRWTLTVIGKLLRDHGSGEVFPVALADTSGR